MQISSTTIYARETARTQAAEKKPEEDYAVKLQKMKQDAQAQLQAQAEQPKPVVNAQGQTTGQLINTTA
jgi:hypothetical protein